MRIKLIDGNSVGFAQQHAQDARPHDGSPRHAVFGMLRHIRNSLYFETNSLHVVVWDGRAEWRYAHHPQYKSTRHLPEAARQARLEYEAQRPLVQEALSHFPVLQLTHPKAEADDVAFGLSRILPLHGYSTTLFTADRDWLQLVGPQVRWVNARPPHQVVTPENFAENTGFANPAAFALAKALVKDTSDDIQGLPGIGPVTAQKILQTYGTLEAFEAYLANTSPAERKHPLSKLDSAAASALIRFNLPLVNLTLGPTLLGSDVQLCLGEANDLELYSFLMDHGLTEFMDDFEHFFQPLTADVRTLLCNLAGLIRENLESAWQE